MNRRYFALVNSEDDIFTLVNKREMLLTNLRDHWVPSLIVSRWSGVFGEVTSLPMQCNKALSLSVCAGCVNNLIWLPISISIQSSRQTELYMTMMSGSLQFCKEQIARPFNLWQSGIESVCNCRSLVERHRGAFKIAPWYWDTLLIKKERRNSDHRL